MPSRTSKGANIFIRQVLAVKVFIKIKKDTGYTSITTKDMPGHKVGRLWKFMKAESDEWVRAGGTAMAQRMEGSE